VVLRGRVSTRKRQLAKNGPVVLPEFGINQAHGIDARTGARKRDRLKVKIQKVVIAINVPEAEEL